ncbi:uncharacterized protein LOC116805306 [Drosophila grimshawi]|uniref:uncharacterized protein LOC116805306 n=1 Tax=Drosophila grimshawi TaxID=7222 RepID=UPI000C86F82E|nr:uncharacterized protein LOC116805306 [Drosophila grimshawi]
MAAKNVNKITSMNPIALARILSRSYVPHRYIHYYKQLRKQTQKTVPDFSRIMNKSSATSLIRDEIVKKNNINAEKRYEIQQAADQVRKSNDMLKEHYLLKRQEQASLIKGALQQLPMLSRKLNDIMARDWVSSIQNPPVVKINRCYGLETKSNIVDYKPQVSGCFNRWHMKIPSQKLEIPDENKTQSSYRSRKSFKVLKPPEVELPEKKLRNERNEQKPTPISKIAKKAMQMWQIGDRRIPRLDC